MQAGKYTGRVIPECSSKAMCRISDATTEADTPTTTRTFGTVCKR